MSVSSKPFAEKKSIEINGVKMAYIDEGEGDPIIFQHGNPTSSYLWRNVMPHCKGLGRLIACDLVGMGDSGKLSPSGPERYTFKEQREFLHALWDKLNLGNKAILVLHDWGSALGFDWANQHRDRIQGIAYMESIVKSMTWDEFPETAHDIFRAFRSPAGEGLVLEANAFVEQLLPGAIMRSLSDEEMNHYRQPFLQPGEDRRPTLTWPRQIPLDGAPVDVVEIVDAYSAWLAQSEVPKLFINSNPGSLAPLTREYCRTWKNQTEVTVDGLHFIQEDSPNEIGRALADFVKKLRNHPVMDTALRP